MNGTKTLLKSIIFQGAGYLIIKIRKGKTSMKDWASSLSLEVNLEVDPARGFLKLIMKTTPS